MSLTIAAGTFSPDTSGPATYVATLSPELAARGCDVHVVTYGEAAAAADRSYRLTTVSRRGGLLGRYLRYGAAVYRAARGADLVYLQGPVSEGVPGALAARLARRPYVLKVVGDYAWEQAGVQFGETRTIDEFQSTPNLDGRKVRLMRLAQRAVARRARLVITPSDYLRKLVLGWGVPEARVVVVRNAFTSQPTVEDRASLRAQLGLSGPTVLSVGRLVPWKRVPELIRSFGGTMAKVPGATLVVIGDGPSRPEVEAAAARPDLAGAVRLCGQLPHREVLRYLAAADCLVLNSTYEGLSHVLLEAAAAGLPTVATDVCGNAEAVLNGQTGTLVPPHEPEALTAATVSCLLDPRTRSRAAAAAATLLQRYSPSRMVEETLWLLDGARSAATGQSRGGRY